jgi:hypothetical protein
MTTFSLPIVVAEMNESSSDFSPQTRFIAHTFALNPHASLMVVQHASHAAVVDQAALVGVGATRDEAVAALKSRLERHLQQVRSLEFTSVTVDAVGA